MHLPRSVALLAVLSTAAFAQKPLTVAVGSQKSLTIPGLQRLAVENGAVLGVKTIGNNELLLIGASAGHTTLLVWKSGTTPERYEVTVTGPGSVVSAAPPTAPDITPPPSFSPTLKVGQKVTRATVNLQRVAVGDSDTADITAGEGTLTLEALKPGRTNVLLWFVDGHREQWQLTVVK